MNKYALYLIAGIILITAVFLLSNQPQTNQNAQSPSPNQEIIAKDSDSTPMQVIVDTELNQLDKELSEIKETDFDPSSLSDKQLGL